LRGTIHFVDNASRDANKHDKLFKIRPILEMVRANCLKIDEQIIPAKTRRSGIRQYNPKKPVKWGFKMFVRAGQTGMMYDFFLYLMLKLKSIGVVALGTIRSNRLQGCPLQTEKEMKKAGRGSSSYR